MKFIMTIILVLMSLNIFASPVEVIESGYFSEANPDYTQDRNRCMNRAYDLETKAMEKTNDSNVKVRMSRVAYHPAGIMYCFVKFFPTYETNFVKETQSFKMKKCQGKERIIAAEANVVWTDFENRVKLPSGIKGCRVHSVRAKQ